MKPTSLLISILVFLSTTAVAEARSKKWYGPQQDFGNKFQWNLIWDDDFDWVHPEWLPEPYNWQVIQGHPTYSGEEDSVTTYIADRPFVQASHLGTLLLLPKRGPGSNATDKWYSGRVETKNAYLPGPGKTMLFEARVKIGDALTENLAGISHKIYSIAPEFWDDTQTWPRMGEWEILELKNGVETFLPALHCGELTFGPCKEPGGFSPGPAYSFSRGQFHRIGFVVDRSMCALVSEESDCWKMEHVTWYLDDQEKLKITGEKFGNKDAWHRLFHRARLIGMTVTVGGTRVGDPNYLTSEGVSAGMEIDYFGVWESKYPKVPEP